MLTHNQQVLTKEINKINFLYKLNFNFLENLDIRNILDQLNLSLQKNSSVFNGPRKYHYLCKDKQFTQQFNQTSINRMDKRRNVAKPQ